MLKSIFRGAASALILISPSAYALPPGALPQPEFVQRNFLLTPDIPEMNVDFAIAWTDSADWANPGQQYQY